MGHIPHPSLAVVPTDSAFLPFGTYTAIVNPRSVRPSKTNPLYSRDVYTERGPRTARKGEAGAEDLLEDADAYLTKKLAVEQAPVFHSWESYRRSPHGAKLLSSPVDFTKLDLEFARQAEAAGKLTPDSEFLGLNPQLLEFLRSMPSEYGELKMSENLPFSNLLFVTGPRSSEVRSLAEDVMGVPFEPSISQLRSNLSSLIRKYGGEFKQGGLAQMKGHYRGC